MLDRFYAFDSRHEELDLSSTDFLLLKSAFWLGINQADKGGGGVQVHNSHTVGHCSKCACMCLVGLQIMSENSRTLFLICGILLIYDS
jgi:hypothetical protein